MSRKKMCLSLFWNFMKMGLFMFGGGYAMIPFIKTEVVEKKQWLTEEEMVDMLAISEVTPGPIIVNIATFVGSRIAGIWGAFFCTVGVIIPAFVLIILCASILAQINHLPVVKYAFMGIRAGVIVLMFSASINIYKQCKKNILTYIVIIISCALVVFTNVNIILVIMIGALVGIIANIMKGVIKN